MTITRIETFIITGRTGAADFMPSVEKVEFIPLARKGQEARPGFNWVPGFTHRIAFQGQLTASYLGDNARPTRASALYFATKLGEVA